MIPDFTVDDVLPAADYEVTTSEIAVSHLVTGINNRSLAWDATWRKYLVINLELMVNQLWNVGIDQIYIDGSFVENKDHPNDIDGYFECDARRFVTGELERELNALDPFKIWTWDHRSRKLDPNSPKLQLPMWHRYRVELYPHWPGNLCGIQDRFGNELEFPSAFRQSRSLHRQKGILKIKP